MEQVKVTSTTVFDTILAPLLPLLEEQCAQLKDDANTYRLSLAPFVLSLVFAALNKIKSISLLITEIDSSTVACEIGLIKVSMSMYSEALVRYHAAIFRNLFLRLLERLNFLIIPELQLLGNLVCVDGSLIPAIQTMSWAKYKKSVNALKIHLALNLNRMIPVQIISTDANTSERAMLAQLLEAGITYIADRGYLSFKMIRQVIYKKAFFIFRMKSNWKYTIEQALDVSIPAQWQGFVHEVMDQKISSEVPLDIGRDRLAVPVAFVRQQQVGLQVLLDDAVEDGLLGMATGVRSRSTSPRLGSHCRWASARNCFY